jgi:hypothetical protein
MNCLEKRILESPSIGWDWKALTQNKAISLCFIIKTIEDLPWDFHILSNEIPLSVIDKYPKKEWDWRKISMRATHKDVITYKNIKWDWYVLSNRNDIVSNLLTDYPNLPWQYNILSTNNLGYTKRDDNLPEISTSIINTRSIPKEKSNEPRPSTPLPPTTNTVLTRSSNDSKEEEGIFVELAKDSHFDL